MNDGKVQLSKNLAQLIVQASCVKDQLDTMAETNAVTRFTNDISYIQNEVRDLINTLWDDLNETQREIMIKGE